MTRRCLQPFLKEISSIDVPAIGIDNDKDGIYIFYYFTMKYALKSFNAKRKGTVLLILYTP